MFRKILVANRGEIACRIMRTARRMGIATVAVYSDADRDALHVEMADEAVHIGPPPASESYLQIDRIIAACRQTGADAVHPGYGFLSERAAFAEALSAAGITFIGPNPRAIAALGDKIESKKLAAAAKVTTVPGQLASIETDADAMAAARAVGLPVMIKASAGGGGKGMRIVRIEAEVSEAVRAARSEAKASFGDDRVFVERYVEHSRHIEIQVMGDRHGNVVWLGERECSIQRRNQKVVEESPSPAVDAATRKRMGDEAVALAKAVQYDSAGTVEFIMDQAGRFYFLEMNTRLQVEHSVTEFLTGLDLVELMIRVAAGETLPFAQRDVKLGGWAIEARVCAEDPARDFLPSIGRLTTYRPPPEAVVLAGMAPSFPLPGGERAMSLGEASRGGEEDRPSRRSARSDLSPPGRGEGPSAPGPSTNSVHVRVDTGAAEGSEISVYYDPLIAKLIVHAPDRATATAAMARALDGFALDGVINNRAFVAAIMATARWREGRLSTDFIKEEFPDGFAAAVPDRAVVEMLAVVAMAIALREHDRLVTLPGRLNGEGKRRQAEWIVRVGSVQFTATAVQQSGRQASIALGGGAPRTVASGWRIGDPVWRGTIDGAETIVQVRRSGSRMTLSHQGVALTTEVLSPQVAALAALMPAKRDKASSKQLRCPMPGVVRAINAEPGQMVSAGDPLAIVEAMKMENVLRAERDATVARVLAKPGDTLAVDAVILEFE